MKLEKWVIGNAVRAARMEKRWSQEELAEKVNIATSHLKHIEGGRRSPSVEVLYELAKLLNFSIDALFFPETKRGEPAYEKANRLLRACNEKQLRAFSAAMEIVGEEKQKTDDCQS